MKTLKKYWILYRENLVITVILQLIAFLVGFLLVLFINASINQDEDFAAMGSFFAIFMAVVLAIYRIINPSHMFLSVGMGQTRRSFLLCDTFYHTINFLISIAVCRLLYWIEMGICTRLYPGFENAIPLEKFFSLPVIGLMTAVVAGLGLLFLMLKVRFGHGVFIITWIAFWALFMVVSRVISDIESGKISILATIGKGVIGLAGALPVFGWILIGYGFVAVLAAVGVLGLRRAEIRQ